MIRASHPLSENYCTAESIINGIIMFCNLIGCYYRALSSNFCFVCSFFVFSCPNVIFCEAVAIYGVIVAIIRQTKLESVPTSKMYDAESLRAGYAIFASGIIVGLPTLYAGLLCVGIIGSSCALSDAQNSTLFVKILVIEIFGSALGLFGVIVGIIMSAQATWPTK
ncbi:hypothetical protein HID58_013106 [Brassica napus]|uniref:V-ATPase proteolipid subunit C-like domain-containing protein n=3 Tax=Brassica TaxID=3705 RepID=A0ABQ8E2Z5_BRANA|nr:hypothetical protein HID58_013106 [Brassica napus]CDY13493.1 BnaA03g52110D [Brassica napus]VDC83974.1 unnamed protein product [Brassica rapa]